MSKEEEKLLKQKNAKLRKELVSKKTELKIEAALERTRTQSMIMQYSNELDDTIFVFHEQVQLLGINSAFSFLWLPDEEKEKHIFWAIWEENKNGSIIFKNKAINYTLDRNEPATAQCLVDWKGNEPVVSYHVPLDGVKNYFAAWQELIDGVEKLTPEYFAGGLYYVEAFMKYGCFGVMLASDLTEAKKKILGRFGIEFERTYTRFLDLQKAEAQAREAKIEASLERVRSKTMAMHHSYEMPETASVLFQQLKDLGLMFWISGFCIWRTDGTPFVENWVNDGVSGGFLPPILLPFKEDTGHRNIYEASLRGELVCEQEIFGEALATHYQWMRTIPSAKVVFKILEKSGLMPPEKQWKYAAIFKQGYLLIISAAPDPAIGELGMRFAKVFEQAYTRFLDLQKAEAQAKESQIEAALERVRSRTLAMQKSDELAETASELFRQLIQLGIEPNRLYITIIQAENGEAEFWITDEDGSKVSAAYMANLNKNESFQKMYEGWKQQKKSLIIDMNGEELQIYFQYLTSLNVSFKGGLTQKRRIQHLAYFSKGFIGMASPDEQPAETIQLLERFAYVFNLTFTRFNDLKIAEANALQAEQDLIEIKAAREKAEDTLTELQSTQKQLIQSEKMASLGELTAGIAHEIQNPLNFVNNFSEVNKELLIELNNEIEKGNYNDAKAIVKDVITNEQKINHHGKRADAIVKGMLQHSRASSGQKEPTDINALCDEYLRLSYHGLRAKDKSYNATIKTDFDPTIGNINIIPQDFGRVILNLINNAFYTVNEKKNQFPEGYEPTVSVSTKKIGNTIEIKVSDNGSGIRQKVLDKIFQPFFTTKPTGQGTGLGLSLSYDIVKAHGGEIKVSTKESGGSEFTITLPVLQ